MIKTILILFAVLVMVGCAALLIAMAVSAWMASIQAGAAATILVVMILWCMWMAIVDE